MRLFRLIGVCAVIAGLGAALWILHEEDLDPSRSFELERYRHSEHADSPESLFASSSRESAKRSAASDASSYVASSSQGEQRVEGDAEALDWADAKLAMRSHFDLDEARRSDLRENVTTLVPYADEYPMLKRGFDVEDDVDWHSVFGSDLTALQVEDLNFMLEEARPVLSRMADDVEGLTEHFLEQYWDHDLGYRHTAGAVDSAPKGYWHTKGGVYNVAFGVLEGGWHLYANFDSVDFPVLDEALRESRRYRNEFYGSITAIVRAGADRNASARAPDAVGATAQHR